MVKLPPTEKKKLTYRVKDLEELCEALGGDYSERTIHGKLIRQCFLPGKHPIKQVIIRQETTGTTIKLPTYTIAIPTEHADMECTTELQEYRHLDTVREKGLYPYTITTTCKIGPVQITTRYIPGSRPKTDLKVTTAFDFRSEGAATAREVGKRLRTFLEEKI